MAVRALLAGLLAAVAVGQASGTDGLYVLGPDDQILVREVDLDEFPATPIRIDAKGDINLPLIGRIQAGGKTIQQLEDELTAQLRKYLRDPQVTVAVSEFRSRPVSVFGAVVRPGVLQLRGPRTLWEVISDAGGFQNDVGDKIRIIRRLDQGAIPLPRAHVDETGQYSVVDLDVSSVSSMANPAENIALMPNDVISVSKANIVYVVGDVNRAGGFVTNGAISVLEALSLAGGFAPRAAPGKARILRAQEDSDERLQIPVDLKRLIQGSTEDLRLRPNDILFVPHSTMKDVTLGALQAVTSIATSVVIWRAGTRR